MKPEDFAKWARKRGEPLRVDAITVVTPTGTFAGRGTLKVEGEKLMLKVTLNDLAQLPEVSGTYTREQFWKISGRIEERLPFQTIGLSTKRSTHHGHFAVEQARFDLDHLSFVTEHTRAQDNSTAAFFAAEPEPTEPATFWGRAFLEGHKPFATNAGTKTKTTNDFLGDSSQDVADTYKGDFGDFEYAMIRVEKDCEAYLRTKKGSRVSEDEFRATFTAFRTAMAFIHGREVWPQHITINHGFHTLLDEVHPPRELASTSWCLLSERTCAHGADLGLALVSATKFFLHNDTISELVQRSLYLCRQSSSRVTPLDVGTLSMCAVLEGLVTTLHRQLAAPDKTPEAIAFESARNKLLALARRRESRGVPGFVRLVGLLSAAKPYRMKEAMQSLATHLDLRWEPEMKDAFAAWTAERNALAHGSEPDDESCDRMTNQSRLAGAVNLIVARLIGYSGLAVFSAVESRLVRLEPYEGEL